MKIVIDTKEYPIEIIKKNNKNTYIRVKNGKIIVTTNYLTSTKTIQKLINDNLSSIKRMINSDLKKIERNEKFYYFGKEYDVVLGFSNLEINNDKIYAKDKKQLDKYILENIKTIYLERLKYFYNLFEEKIPVPNLKIRNMTSRWGVCNIKNHNVTLNYQLYKYDIKCLDYVIVHELSHFIHPNHSKDYWLLVSKYCPNYKKIKLLLKE